jgi:tRNA (Thr-GGU) A37 N-methylase
VRGTEFTFRPIGILRKSYSSKSGLPIQGVFDRKSRGRAEIFGESEPGLQDIEGFSHLVLL